MVSTQCMNLSFPVRHGGTLTHNPYCQSHRVIHPSLPMPLLPNHCPCPEKACLDQHLISPVKSLPDQDSQRPEQPLLRRVFQPPEQPHVHDSSCSDRSPFHPASHSIVSSSLVPQRKASPSFERLKPVSPQFSHPAHWVVLDHPSTVSSIPSAFCSRMLTPYAGAARRPSIRQ